jgi:hypothetical protein
MSCQHGTVDGKFCTGCEGGASAMTKAEQKIRRCKNGAWWYLGRKQSTFHCAAWHSGIAVSTKQIRNALRELDAEMAARKR